MIKKLFLIILVIVIAFILSAFDVRFCPIFNLFNVPCVGCGLTRAVKLIFHGKILESFKYNILPIPLLILILIYVCLYIINKEKLNFYVEKYKWSIIFISFCVMIVVWYINLNNDLLY